MRLFRTLLAAAFFSATALATAGAEDVPITSDQDLSALFAGKTFYGNYPSGGRWIEYYRPDGVSAYRENGATCTARWYLERGRACFSYPNRPEPDCFDMKRRNLLLVFDSGDPETSPTAFKVVDGDAENLMAAPMGKCQ
jgi:hypothetical protein